MVFSELFFTNLYIATYALMGWIMHGCYQSKCSTVDLCCLKIIRDTGAEEDIDLATAPTTDMSTL